MTTTNNYNDDDEVVYTREESSGVEIGDVCEATSPCAKFVTSTVLPRRHRAELFTIEMHDCFHSRDLSKEILCVIAFPWKLFISRDYCAFLQLHAHTFAQGEGASLIAN